MEMSKVIKCEVEDCSYNMNNVCNAMAITIGHDIHPMCDTFCHADQKGGQLGCLAGVGACKVSCCSYNNGLECCASEISVGYQNQEPDCLTFKSR